MKKAEVEIIARDINDISLDYHLSHATFACDRLIRQKFKEYIEERLKKLSEELRTALRRQDSNETKRLTAERDALSSKLKFQIYVEYVPNMSIDAARVVKTGSQLVINLPKSLLDSTRNSEGLYNLSSTKKLRRMMAHELGHIALHIKELLEIDGLNGSKELRNEQAEIEAEWFAEKLLQLRHDRNKYIYDNKLFDIF